MLSAEDIDKVCYDGLGPRYAFIGPLETMHLNADGEKSKIFTVYALLPIHIRCKTSHFINGLSARKKKK